MDIIWYLIYINEVVAIFFFELSEMKDKKYPKKVWIDLIYLDSIFGWRTKVKRGCSFIIVNK